MTNGERAAGRLVVLDDSPLLASQLQQLVAGFGFAVETIQEPAVFAEVAATADLAFVEIQLLHANGFQLARQVRATGTCKVVLLSGSGRSTDLHWGLRAGAVAVLKRPLRPEQLRELLDAEGLLPDRAGTR